MLILVFVAYFIGFCRSSEYEFVKKGDESFTKGRYSEAIKYYNSAMEINPLTRYKYKRAEVRFLLKQFTNSIIDLNQIINEEPTNLQARRLLGKIYFQTGKFDHAEEQFSYILGLRPDDKNAVDFLSKTKVAKQRLEKILTDEDRVRVLPYIIKEFSPESREFRLSLADTAIRTKQFNLAKPEIHWLLKRDPSDGFVHHLYACKFLYEAMGDIEEGKSGLKKCLNLDPENTKCFKCFKRIKKLQRLSDEIREKKEHGRSWKAVRLYEDWLDMASPEQYNYEEFAIEYCKTIGGVEGKEELALTACETRCPSHPHCDLVRAEQYVSLQKFEEARAIINQVRENYGDDYNQLISQINEKLKLEEKKANRIDYYKLLNVSKRATPHEIKKAYKKKAMKFHPDRAKTPEEKEEFSKIMVQVNTAVEILMDEEKRQRYDAGDDVNDIFGNRPGGSGGGRGFHGSHFNFNFGDFNFGGQGGRPGGFFRNF